MTPQDYKEMLNRLAKDFIKERLASNNWDNPDLIDNMKNNPSAVQFNGFAVSSFNSLSTPELCASIIVSSDSQNIDKTICQEMPPNQALFAMAFEMLKIDLWNQIVSILEGMPDDKNTLEGSTEQLTMFDPKTAIDQGK